MPYVTDSQLNSIAGIPISLPAAELAAGDWLVVTQVALAAGSTLEWKLGFIQLQAAAGGALARRLTASAGVSLGVGYLILTDQYIGAVDQSLVDSALARVDLPNSLVPPSAPAGLTGPISLSVPAGGKTYTVLAVNNTTANRLKLVATGQLRVTQP